MVKEKSFFLLTFVLQKGHCLVLEDWLKFFDWPPIALVVHVGPDPEIVESLESLAKRYETKLIVLGQTSASETTENEIKLLWEQFEPVGDGVACIIRLDTLPYIRQGLVWQENTLSVMNREQACFITGATLKYRADLPSDTDGLMLTQRFSNCFAIIPAPIWRKAQSAYTIEELGVGRFAPEAAIEQFCKDQDIWGIRLLNSPDLRVFHCQEWGSRMEIVRRAFFAGKGIDTHLVGFQDDYMGARIRHYMQKPTPIWRRARIVLGRWRRQVFRSNNLT